MKTENKNLMRMAKESLKGKWGLAVGTFVIYALIMGSFGWVPYAGPAATLVLGGPFLLGITIFSLNISRNNDPKLEQLFHGFRNFGTSIGAYLLMVLFIFLWTLLLIVPGIIAAISYSMTFFIIADDPAIAPMDALKKSKKMMYGNKWKLFCLYFRFFGWFLLCILTFGVGFLWLIPYMRVSFAKFYDDIKDNPGRVEDLTAGSE